MIFVTAGMLGSDEITRKIDEITPRLKEDVFVTIGKGIYIPKNCKWVRYTTTITDYFKKADLIITHGGGGTLFECLLLKKRIIAIPLKRTDDQSDIITKLSEEGFIIKCENLNELEKCIRDKRPLKKYVRPKCTIGKTIENFLIKG